MTSAFKSAGIAICFVTVLIAFGWWQVDGPGKKDELRNIPVSLTNMDFQMTNHLGLAVHARELVGMPTMVFFGFTFCPDICPTTLNDISSWISALGDDAKSLNVVFITVDPERDNVDAVAEYLSYFNPMVKGWIGNEEQLREAAKLFGITYKRVETGDGEYTMDHTSGVYLFRADGRFARTIDYHESREQALPKIKRTIFER